MSLRFFMARYRRAVLGAAASLLAVSAALSAVAGESVCDAQLALAAESAGAEAAADADAAELSAFTGWATDAAGVRHWYDAGVMAADKAFYDPGTDAWYWADADGSIATGKDVFIPVSNDDRSAGKWVRFDENSRMVKGEDNRYGGWYYFDEASGEMAKGVRLVEGGDGWKWVYYDVISGQMAHGEAYLSYDADHRGWYSFDDVSGAMAHGFAYVAGQQKWAFYDEGTGAMAYGERCVDGEWYLLDSTTGAVCYGWQRLGDGRIVHYDGVSGTMDYGEATFGGRTYDLDEATGALRQDQAETFALAVPADAVASTDLASRLAGGSVKSVRLFGDSIMAGIGASGYEGTGSRAILSYEGITYHEPLPTAACAANALRSRVLSSGAAFVNASVPGIGSMNLFSRVGADQLGSESFAVVVLGTNDRGAFDPNETLDGYVDCARMFLTGLSERYSGNIVVLSSAPVEWEDYNFTLGEADAALGDLCRSQGWSFGSLYRAFEALREAEGFDAACLYTDGTHLNNRGQELLWNAMAQVLRL